MDMKKRFKQLLQLLVILFSISILQAEAGELHIAVAANFIAPLTEISAAFEDATDHRIVLIPGSTGKHYAQIINGAPFDVFFSADTEHPTLLDNAGLAIHGSRYTYALGRLVLWSPQRDFIQAGGDVLTTDNFRYIAIANPRLAPYGKAAREMLQKIHQWERLKTKLVQGENISQAFQFVYSGNAELGFIAHSQLIALTHDKPGSSWLVPENMHAPIAQQAIQLTDSGIARLFLDYAKLPEAQQIILKYGYDLPKPADRPVSKPADKTAHAKP
jgi:molybdate transport system substrate-binding protein